MLLQLIVTHYKEHPGYVERFLDSVKVQDYIDKNDFEVLLINDGNEKLISENLLSKYDFKIKYLVKDWSGLSDSRQFGMDHATADYIMFCDCDDLFSRIDSLYKILECIKKTNADFIIGSRFQDVKGKVEMLQAKSLIGSYEIHGKVYKRAFLLEKNIKWNKDIIIWNEDFYFNNLVLCEKPKISLIDDAIYIYKYRPDSITDFKKNNSIEKQLEIRLSLIQAYILTLKELKLRNNKEYFKTKLIDLLFQCFDVEKRFNIKNLDQWQTIRSEFSEDFKLINYKDLINRLTSTPLNRPIINDLILVQTLPDWLASKQITINLKEVKNV